MALAIFDLDNTLLNGDSDHAWGEFLVTKGIVPTEEFQNANDYFYEQYKQGGLDIYEYIAFVAKPLQSQSPEQLDALRQEYLRDWVQPMMLPKAAELLAKHRAQGDFLLIITATNGFVTRPIAEKLGVDDILATELEQIDGRFTGNIAGTPCFQAGKVSRLNQWLEKNTNHTLKDSYFYSDSFNDLPLLEVVDTPIAVDADDTLSAAAKEKGWQHISLR